MRFVLILIVLTSGLACEKTIREASGVERASGAPAVSAGPETLPSRAWN